MTENPEVLDAATVTTAEDIARHILQKQADQMAQQQETAAAMAQKFAHDELLEKRRYYVELSRDQIMEMWPRVWSIVLDVLKEQHKLQVEQTTKYRRTKGWLGTSIGSKEETYVAYTIRVPQDIVHSLQAPQST